jgi:hypothetical protein
MIEDINWSVLTDASIDINRVEPTEAYKAGASQPMWVADSSDGTTRIYFGVASDPGNVIPEGQHKGWEAAVYELVTEDGEVTECHISQHYEEPENLKDFLALVGRVCK